MEHSTSNNQFCTYYQSRIIKPEKTWFVVATLKSFDHLAYDRAIENDPHNFEFFVPCDMEPLFLDVMAMLAQEGLVDTPVKMKNRLI